MKYDFTTIPDRTNTGSLKWDKYKNKDILPFWVADMDFLVAPEIRDALHQRINHQVYGYTIPYEEVEHAVLSYLKREHKYKVLRESLVWLPGLVPALNIACRAFCQKDESVMVCTPVYPPFLSAPEYANRGLITVPLLWDQNRWTFDFDSMERSITSQTRLFLLCSPHNPVGQVFSKVDLNLLGDFCCRHDLILCSDEIHCDLILDDKKHRVTATLSKALEDRTITFMAPSKTYNLPGLACAYAIISNSKLRYQFQKVARGIITEVNVMGYSGCVSAYNYGETWRKELLNVLRINRNILLKTLSEETPQIELKAVEATYLAWLNISKLSIKHPCLFFEEAGVGLSDGAFFGDGNYVRLNFGCPEKQLKNGLDRIISAVKKLGL